MTLCDIHEETVCSTTHILTEHLKEKRTLSQLLDQEDKNTLDQMITSLKQHGQQLIQELTLIREKYILGIDAFLTIHDEIFPLNDQNEIIK